MNGVYDENGSVANTNGLKEALGELANGRELEQYILGHVEALPGTRVDITGVLVADDYVWGYNDPNGELLCRLSVPSGCGFYNEEVVVEGTVSTH